MAQNYPGLAMTDIFVLCYFAYLARIYWKESNGHLKSIDKKMHTHAADDSVNGIGGWY
jgi:hypothetical protein